MDEDSSRGELLFGSGARFGPCIVRSLPDTGVIQRVKRETEAEKA